MSNYICEELVVEIFTRLPVKSVLRFRSVSKSLCSRIDNPSFIRLHTSRSPQKLLIFHRDVKERSEPEYFYTLHSEDQLPLSSYDGATCTPLVSPLASCVFDTGGLYVFNSYIVGSYNGILCLKSAAGVFTLWNPSIRRKLTISDDYPYHYDRSDRNAYLMTGFGFDPILNDYKIVSLACKYRQSIQRSFVYTMKTGTWCEIASPPTVLFCRKRTGTFFNGLLHWIVTRHKDHPCIMTLDLSTHKFDTIELPIKTTDFDIITINGSLALFLSLNNSIWSRREHNKTRNSSWHVDFRLKKGDYYFVLTRVLQLTPNGCFLLDCPLEGFHTYNPQTKVLSKLVNYNVSSRTVLMEKCVESLELLDTGTTCEVNRPSTIKTLQNILGCVDFVGYSLVTHLKNACQSRLLNLGYSLWRQNGSG